MPNQQYPTGTHVMATLRAGSLVDSDHLHPLTVVDSDELGVTVDDLGENPPNRLVLHFDEYEITSIID
jgi:hypothetical protein